MLLLGVPLRNDDSQLKGSVFLLNDKLVHLVQVLELVFCAVSLLEVDLAITHH
jgi:hypothetical protein